MSIRDFIYLEPKTMAEALEFRAMHGAKSSIIAGGTDLLVKMRAQVLQPDYVIGLNRIPGIDHINIDAGTEVVIGAMATLSLLAEHEGIINHFPALAHAASVTATVQIRNMGTLVGNICNASPSADNATPLLVYDAQLVVVNQAGERVVALDHFFAGPGKTILEQGDIVKEILIPFPGSISGSSYQKVSTRSKVDIAGICVSALISLDSSGKVLKARIALGAVAPIPMRVYKAEELLTGTVPDSELLIQAAKIAREASAPISDMRSSADYRKAMVEVLTLRALNASLESAKQRSK